MPIIKSYLLLYGKILNDETLPCLTLNTEPSVDTISRDDEPTGA